MSNNNYLRTNYDFETGEVTVEEMTEEEIAALPVYIEYITKP